MSEDPQVYDYSNPEENEPHLGPWWFVLMITLYWLKELFPTEKYTLFWYFQIYILSLCTLVTFFVIYKRWRFNKTLKEREKEKD